MVYKRQFMVATIMAGMGVLALTAAAPASAGMRTAGPAGTVSGINVLYSAACPTSKACVAVGIGGTDDDFGKSAVINASTGAAKAWSGSLANDPLNAVACAAGATTCLTVADDAVATVKVSTGAMKVTGVPAKPSSGIVALNAIACASAKACYAVGFEGTEASSHAIVLALSGAGKIVKTTVDTGTGSGAIACPASTRCLLSDYKSPLTSIQVLTRGKIGKSHPLPADIYVQAISCYKASLCYALAGNTKSSPLATDELFSLNPVTGKPGSVVKLSGFSGTKLACVSATRCVVAGFAGGVLSAKPATVIVTSGKAGKAVHQPGQSLSGIGCASASVCYAVGEASGKAIVDKVSA
jgi:hypothetical protein